MRPDPDALLAAVDLQEKTARRARLRIFLGMSAGVGKTCAMLQAAHQRLGDDGGVLVGIVETHGRAETAALLAGLEILPRRKIEYRGATLEEMDIDEILRRRPRLVLVDELAHSNAPGSRHPKRYQDVLELLDAGIDVYTTINVQHLESRKDAVEAITGTPVRETVPDGILERATLVEVVDIAPTELLRRLKEGKVYLGENAARAAENFFQEDRLTALREIALRLTAERVDHDLRRFSGTGQQSPWQTNERLLVGVSHSPFSEKLVRAARRLAYNLEAPWIALYVDTGLALRDEDQAQLARNIALARELGAEVITTTETDVGSALKRIARQKNVTQLLVGRPTRRWIRDVVEGGSLLDRLVRENGEIDVHVIRQDGVLENRPSVWRELLYLRSTAEPVKYFNVFLFLTGVSFLSGLINPAIGYRTVGFLYLLAVLLVGIFAELGPVVFAATFSALVWNYFFIPPTFEFVIRSPEDAILCLAFFAVALITGFLTNRIRLHERVLREREERSNVLYEVLSIIAGSSEKAEFLSRIAERVGLLLDAECGVILKSQHGELQFDQAKSYSVRLNEKARAVAAWAFRSGKAAGWSTDTLAESKSLYLPLRGQSEIVGIFVFQPKSARKLGLEQENLLHSITRQLGLTLERHFIGKRLQETQRLRESEALHQTLLNSISHEIRTPLTAILGGASSLADRKLARDPDHVARIAESLGDAGERLNRVVENLLDMSRLSSGVLSLQTDWEDLNDLVGVVLKKLERPLASHPLKVTLADGVPLAKLDFRLMEHALANLLVNAAMYSPPGTEIRLKVATLEDVYRISIEDEGPGIPAEAATRIFDKFYRVPGSPTGGTGLGLSIVKSIVEIHQGHVRLETSGRGAHFVIELPRGTPPPGPAEKS